VGFIRSVLGKNLVSFGLYRYFTSNGLAQWDAIKALLSGLLAWTVLTALPTSAGATIEGPLSNGLSDLRQTDPNLTGTGVNFAVVCRSVTYLDGKPQNDYLPDMRHKSLRGKKLTFHDEQKLPAGISPHSTAICAILLGQDSNAFNDQLGRFSYKGVAPDAQADVYEFWHFLIHNVFPQNPPQNDIVTLSAGSQFEDWWTRGIESMAARYGLIVVAGIGNGLDVHDPVLYPGASANVIGVGVVDSVNTDNLTAALTHFALAYPEHSSFGPTPDGRCKPDLVAVGNCITAEVNEPNSYQPTGSWSSFSTPIVAGTIGLLVQEARQDPNLRPVLSPDGGNCLIKAILMNSADKLPYWHKGRLEKDDDHQVPLDYIQGAGMLNASAAYKQLTAGPHKPGIAPLTGWDLNQLQKKSTPKNVYKISLGEPNDRLITATVVWNKHYSDTYPFQAMPDRDVNLRLELWAVDANNPNNNYLLDYSDSNVDNLEHIYSPADANYTDYELVDEPNEAAEQNRYALAWNVSAGQHSDNILKYDLNADGIVNEIDFFAMFNNIATAMQTPNQYVMGDINSDGAIDVNDFKILLDHKNLKAPWYTQDNKSD